MAIIDSLRVIGSPETNRVMMGELIRLAQRGLGRRPPEPRKAGNGALIYPFDARLAVLILHYHRTSTRLLWDLYASRANRLEPLYDELLADVARDTRAWLRPGATISVTTRNVDAFAAGSRQIVGTVKNAIVDGARARGLVVTVEPTAPDVEIAVRMHDSEITVSIDLAGGSLSQRGYRTAGALAPLREHLAAVLCMLARYDARSEVFLDPMCGSGTLCIEAALMARAEPRIPHTSDNGHPTRHAVDSISALARIPIFANQLDDAARSPIPLFADTQPIIVGNDIDMAACRAARGNSRRAGVASMISWSHGDFRTLTHDRVAELGRHEIARKGIILCNPPYGHRIDDNQLRSLYRDLSQWCESFRGWRAAFLIGHSRWDEWFSRRPRISKSLRNGSLRVDFCLYDL